MIFLIFNRTWKLVELSPSCTTIGCKWAFRKKNKLDGIVYKLKARFVGKCFKQKAILDFLDTFFW